jgi:hypothetical protein
MSYGVTTSGGGGRHTHCSQSSGSTVGDNPLGLGFVIAALRLALVLNVFKLGA